MAITADVKSQLFKPTNSGGELIRLPSESPPPSPSNVSSDSEKLSPTNTNGRAWTADEHNRFLEGLELFPSGPWKEIAAHVGSRTTRQTMTHAQKYREKIARRKRGLRSSVKETRSLKRRRDQKKRNDAASPCSVTDPNMMMGPSETARRGVDPMDFHGCFVPGPMVVPSQFYGMNPAPETEFSNFAAMLSDFDPLPMSEEEIDFILEAAMVQTPVVQTRHTHAGYVL
ncbi:Myb-like DNA-binding protein [Phytophthora palmivora]|uniref:Myb-like DNA-binding protein n=1 Tax=Phytophthora palmivora TaxID=4796 RepID=A0A2P4X309_9STRA|nr:Myb-like DNA-binding protein [Phytophthora palmivora]